MAFLLLPGARLAICTGPGGAGSWMITIEYPLTVPKKECTIQAPMSSSAAQACATLQLMACTFRGDFEFFAVPALPVGDPGRLIKWQLWSHFGGGVVKVATGFAHLAG